MKKSWQEPISDDLIQGGAAGIAHEIGETLRRTQYLLETGQLPAFKLGRRWYARRSTLRARFAELESNALEEPQASSSAQR